MRCFSSSEKPKVRTAVVGAAVGAALGAFVGAFVGAVDGAVALNATLATSVQSSRFWRENVFIPCWRSRYAMVVG